MTGPTITELVEEYLTVRRGLGFKLEAQGWLLADFARYANTVGHQGAIASDLAVAWAMETTSTDPATAARRLAAVRGLARYRAAFDPATEIPAVGLVGAIPRQRPQPHIYSDDEIAELLDRCLLLHPRQGLRPLTYVAVFSLLAACGLRLSEACRLMPDDVDLAEGVLMVRETKFRKSRLVPLHPTTTEALVAYAHDRDDPVRTARRDGFFRTDQHTELLADTVGKTFRRLRNDLGWTAQGHARRPRIHDLRHTFAVRCLLKWTTAGDDVDRKILSLSTYLGHAKPSETYWYLTAVPELMAITSRRFEGFAASREAQS